MIGITGASGVLGNIITSQLQEANIRFSAYEFDVRDENKMLDWLQKNKITNIIYLASKVAIKEVNEDKESAYDVNVNGIIQTLKAIKKYQKNIHFFFASSSHVYASSDTPIDENYTILPQNTYGLSKHISEQILLDITQQSSQITLCIGRIFSFYHKTQLPPYLYPTMQKRFQEEDLSKPFLLFGAKSERDFLNAEQVCNYIIQMSQKQLSGIYNIGSGNSISILQFVKNFAPKQITFNYDENEKITKLTANISKLKSALNL